MPFTLAHPAAALLLVRWTRECGERSAERSLVFSALVVGSLTPDFPYFLHLRGDYNSMGHKVPGVLYFDVPAGLLALWVVHTVLKFPLLTLFPVSHQERLIPVARGFRSWPLPRFGLTVLSLIIGALSHIAWDLPTHGPSWLVQQFPNVFLARVTVPLVGQMHVCDVLQHGSSLSGMGLLLISYFLWFRHTPRTPVRAELVLPERVRLLLLSGIALSSSLLGVINGYLQALILADSGEAFQAGGRMLFVRFSVIFTLSTVVAELVAYSILWRLFVMKKRDQSQQRADT